MFYIKGTFGGKMTQMPKDSIFKARTKLCRIYKIDSINIVPNTAIYSSYLKRKNEPKAIDMFLLGRASGVRKNFYMINLL